MTAETREKHAPGQGLRTRTGQLRTRGGRARLVVGERERPASRAEHNAGLPDPHGDDGRRELPRPDKPRVVAVGLTQSALRRGDAALAFRRECSARGGRRVGSTLSTPLRQSTARREGVRPADRVLRPDLPVAPLRDQLASPGVQEVLTRCLLCFLLSVVDGARTRSAGLLDGPTVAVRRYGPSVWSGHVLSVPGYARRRMVWETAPPLPSERLF